MKPLTLETVEGAVPHRLYDLSIPDLAQRRSSSIVLPSATDAMNYLGVTSGYFYRNRGTGKQVESKKLNKKFAVRIEKQNN